MSTEAIAATTRTLVRCSEVSEGFEKLYPWWKSLCLADWSPTGFPGGFGESRVQANVHTVTGDVVVKHPLPIRRISTYALAGGGSLIFDPTGNGGWSVPGASSQGRGAFLYGAGADYALTTGFVAFNTHDFCFYWPPSHARKISKLTFSARTGTQ
jgi:hypothetical protein